jgi:hypothetical protein
MHDSFDNALSCDSHAALQAYDRAIDAHLHAWPGVLEATQEALENSPGFALAHALQALVLAGRGEGALAREALARARAVPEVLARESSQIDLIATIIDGRTGEALALLVEHARQHPTDVLAVSTGLGAYGLFAFSGRADHDSARLQFVEALAPHYPDEFPWLLAHRGWARIELGAVQEGLSMAQRALALRSKNAHNAHMVLHGFFEAGQPREALAFVQDWLPCYPSDGLMWGHLNWHQALAELELGEEQRAVAVLLGPLTEHLRVGPPFMGLADFVSLLWRLGLRGTPALPWTLAQEHVQRHFSQGSNVFGELHLAMLAAARRDEDAMEGVRRRLDVQAAKGHEGAPVAAEWVAALRALARNDTEQAQSCLEACLREAVRLGGSGAQRTLIIQTRDTLRAPLAY